MNKRHKLLSLLLSAGIVASAFPSSGTGATSDSIAFYNSKKSILEMKEYDEAYDTNHDGAVNVFDVIRENKEVFQEESYTDLKAQIHSLETQIEILTQKLTEKEDKTQIESDISGINTALSGKVDIQDGKQLSSNDYTDEEKQKLELINNYDDTSIKSDISELSFSLSGKADNQEGKQLSSNDFTDEEKQKLENLNNYDDTMIKSEVSELSGILTGKVDKEEGKQLSSNDYTDEDKAKLENLENYDDAKINDKIDSLVKAAFEEKKEIESSIQNKVNKEEGKELSSNDFTDEEKQKLETLNNYDDTDLKKEIDELKSNLSQLTNNITDPIKVHAFGDSITQGYCYPNDEGVEYFTSYYGYVGLTSSQNDNIDTFNHGNSSGGFVCRGNNGKNACEILNDTDLSNADCVTIAYGVNDYGRNMTLGDINSPVGDGTDNGTVSGNIRYFIETAISKAPYAKIIIISPMNYWKYTRSGTELSESNKYALNTQNSAGYTLGELYNVLKYWCEYYNVNFVDWTYNNPVVNLQNIKTVLKDGIHPCDKMYYQLSRVYPVIIGMV